MTRDITPLMKQYREIKAHHENAILMFRMGDFYEMFYDDAETAARVLGLTLTARNNGGAAEVPLAGVPVKAVSEYLRRLVQHGFRVAICEQVEDPKLARGIVRRAVVETVTPGAAFADDLLESDRNNFLCALHEEGESLGVAAADVSTGTFHLVLTSPRDVAAVLARFTPREVLVARVGSYIGASAHALDGALVTERDAWEFDSAIARDEVARQFGVHSLDGLGMDREADAAVGAAGALIRYIRELQPGGVPHLARPILERSDDVMPLDEMTRRNLELVESLRGGSTLENRADASRSGTLLGVLDRTQTGMGARLIRQWVLTPLLLRPAIEDRLGAVGALVADPLTRSALRGELAQIRDVERLTSKTASGRSNPRELRTLGDSLAHLPSLAAEARKLGPSGLLGPLLDEWDDAKDIAGAIASTLAARPALSIGEGDVIQPGVDAELDELRALRDGGKDAIAHIQASERARTGISSLKVGFNKVFGYYIEVTNTNRHLIPEDYQRRQTLSGAERYVTPALKEHEERVLTATDRIEHRERDLFERIRQSVGAQVVRLQRMAGCLATLDVLTSLAEVAALEGYTHPELHDGFELDIVGGRHPVVERMMPRERFIPNDVHLSADERLVILTGPNMAGKSTILRQVGLTVLMAQIGSFVPATRARLGVVDRIFTRVGASDNLVRGQSTFMVEMAETSAILHTATSRSLVLLDEIGRGTSTYDGVSIAWAVSEHLHDHVGCKTIFATHYHELTQLADELVSCRNYNVGVRESGDDIVFLYRLQPGGADRSYGIEVGRLAGLPGPVIARARLILQLLEAEQLAANLGGTRHGQPGPARDLVNRGDTQLRLFGEAHPVVERLRALAPDRMTPLEAIQELDQLVRAVRNV
jgi:DNA mismatch repair protein MutS